MSEVLPPVMQDRSSMRNIPEKPSNYLVMAILATLCCCVPTGIAAIVFAAQVDSKWAAGDFHGAKESSEKAKFWGFISIALGLVGIFIWFILGGLNGVMNSQTG